MSEQLKDYEKRIAAAASEDNQSREMREKAAKEQSETHNLERSSNRPNKEATPAATGCAGCAAPGCPASTRRASGPTTNSTPGSGPVAGPGPAVVKGVRPTVLASRDGVTLSATVRAGASAAETQALRKFSDSRMTKLVSTGGPMCLCLQLYTEGGIATWRQTDVPNYGHSGVLMMPIKRTPPHDRVDPAAMERQTTPALSRRTGTAEVVLRGVSREPDGRTRELILYTDQVTGKQSVRYRFQTGGQELSAKNEGLTLFTPSPAEEPRQGEAPSGAEPATKPEKAKLPRRQDKRE